MRCMRVTFTVKLVGVVMTTWRRDRARAKRCLAAPSLSSCQRAAPRGEDCECSQSDSRRARATQAATPRFSRLALCDALEKEIRLCN